MQEHPTQGSTSRVLYDPIVRGAFSGNAFLDEDTMASDSATKVASQQSIKAYVDARTPLTKMVRKTADETVNNSDVLQNDDALKLAVTANQVWALRLYLLHNTSAVADIKTSLTGPAGSTIYGRTVATTVLATLIEQNGAGMNFQGDGAAALETIDFLVIIAGTAGDIQLQWAQNTLEATDTKVLANSCLLAVQIA